MVTDEQKSTNGTRRRGRRRPLVSIFVLSALVAGVAIGTEVDASSTTSAADGVRLLSHFPVSPALACFLGGLFGIALLAHRRVKESALLRGGDGSRGRVED